MNVVFIPQNMFKNGRDGVYIFEPNILELCYNTSIITFPKLIQINFFKYE